MPFIQRVVQPVNVAQATAASLGHASGRFHCTPGKCRNNNCINKQSPDGELTNGHGSPTSLTRVLVHQAASGAASEEQPVPPAPAPMKKLKQHVEFLSTSPTRHQSQSLPNSRHPSQQRPTLGRIASAPQSPTAGSSKVVSGHEFDSISNITLSNALRQLASLVLIASDIFDDLQRDLQAVGERAGRVQRKIAAVERRVCAYDPKTVTVPESDLLTFAQRKQHFETDKSFQQELFTGDTRPLSVRQLYTEAGKELPVAAGATAVALASLAHSQSLIPSRSISFNGEVVSSDHEVLQLNGSAGAEDQLLCVSEFGNANRKLRTRIDAEIEIRLPAAIEDLRKWTSSEALGDVTVTPDCMHHVDTSVSTSLVIGENGILTPALSPSVLSADAVDAIYSQNLSQAADSSRHNHHPQALIPNDINKDVPLNHRLPSPEEQTKQIALKYPAEVISVNTSGKHFQRMCAARKSTSGGYAAGTTAGSSSSTSPESAGQAEGNNLDDNVQTVSRRSRSRKVRGKRRNTIAGIDQKEIQDAANGNGESKNASNATSPVAQAHQPVDATSVEAKKSKKFGRSKSSDILKKESAALPYDKGKSTLTRLNSLKQWGRNRFKFMQRTGELGDQLDTSGCSSQNSSAEKADSQHGSPAGERESPKRDIDDECVVHHLVAQKSESRFSHERKPSYSSSEKSMSVSSSGQLRGRLQLSSGSGPLAAAAHVKMRETATLNRQRRNGLHALAGKEEQPHSSSGNWSASSESGRASIGSEITMQPKSSASSTSLNVSTFQAGGAGSGPPSSMLSRRRFLNTSASSSVTSEGTATPELQAEAGAYPGHLDDETSSAYSCDTEGYYTSFHMDSGLRTLKEEEPSPMPGTPLQASLHTSSYSFGSQSNQTVLNAESEYELFGRGSTSTTTSSAGTVCTALLSGAASGPDVPERSSSLGKHSGQSRSQSQSTSASSSTLERSYSSSTIGSTLERTGTIKRNVKMSPTKGESLEKEDGQQEQDDRQQQLEFSESSDLEGVERIERIKQKTAISSKRIPSMCIITPTTSDDDEHQAMDPNRTLTSSLSIEVDHNEEDVDEDEPEQKTPTNSKDHNLNELKQTPTKALSGMFEKLRVKLVPGKSSPLQNQSQTQIQIPIQTMAKPANASAVNDDELYDLAGEYVTIADISNNNNNNRNNNNSRRNTGMGIYYSSDIVSKRVQPSPATVAEYVSLNELPQHLRRHAVSSRSPPESESCAQQQLAAAAAAAASQPPLQPSLEGRTKGEGVPMYAEIGELSEEKPLTLASASSSSSANRRLRPNAEGKLVYDSDSLKRRKGAHTTFAPGPYVKETESALHSAESAAAAAASSSSLTQDTVAGSGLGSVTKSAKLLLLSGGGLIAGNRKVANVRPILAKSPLSRNTNGSMATYQATNGSSYQEQKQLLANRTNPFYETIAAPVASLMMMPSPSGKSNSSTGSTATSSSSSASGHSGEEGYQRFSNIYEQVQPAPSTQPKEDATATPFQRSAPIYWTLQSRRSQPRPQPTGNVTCRDDLYATPIRRADRLPRPAAAAASAAEGSRSNISPIVPRNRAGAFLTSTPTRGGEGDADTSQVPPMKQPSRNWSDDAPERLNTCADRIGQSKTTLMDFKKLLLAKSAKASPVQRKVSAVELLKKSTQATPSPVSVPAPKISVAGQKAPSTGSKPTINSSLKLLDLSGSPKTFANRRMLRQGQFGSPSKTFAPKMRGPVNVVAAAAAPPRTDIMSTTIPEANSEEDQSNTSGGSRASSEAGETTAPSSFDLKRNFFLQTEENNFMRGELKPSFARTNGAAGGGVGGAGGAGAEGNKYVAAPVANPQLPSFETAL
ncbi:serine-rich adhesin for platelets isoform X1 [Drosophila elegans]|uniref:serine-rich adhesin for platelets isoform X1 n=1 Tax=Drosophila elegans TaxID=30023 RepID=UPI0007E871D2|nr:serine-rich adhesin for platelets isoform X1 [Drosophila elegans]